MRTRVILGVVAALASVLAFAPQAQAATNCPANPPNGSTVAGNITVPSGVCILQEVTVTGNVKVSPGAELIMQGGKVLGNVTTTDGWIYMGAFRTVPHVAGTVTINAPRNWLDCGIVVGGDYTERDETVVVPPPVAFPPCGAVVPEQVGGNLTFLNNTTGITFFLTSANGNFTATGNTGGSFDQLTISGSATCSNTPPVTFTNSTVGGTNKCPG